MKTYKLTPRNFLTPDLTHSKTRLEKNSNEKLLLKKKPKLQKKPQVDSKLHTRTQKSSSHKIKNSHNNCQHIFEKHLVDDKFGETSHARYDNGSPNILFSTRAKIDCCLNHPDVQAKFKVFPKHMKPGTDISNSNLCLYCA